LNPSETRGCDLAPIDRSDLASAAVGNSLVSKVLTASAVNAWALSPAAFSSLILRILTSNFLSSSIKFDSAVLPVARRAFISSNISLSISYSFMALMQNLFLNLLIKRRVNWFLFWALITALYSSLFRLDRLGLYIIISNKLQIDL